MLSPSQTPKSQLKQIALLSQCGHCQLRRIDFGKEIALLKRNHTHIHDVQLTVTERFHSVTVLSLTNNSYKNSRNIQDKAPYDVTKICCIHDMQNNSQIRQRIGTHTVKPKS